MLPSPLCNLEGIRAGSTTRKLIPSNVGVAGAVQLAKRVLNVAHIPAAYCRQRHTSRVRVIDPHNFSGQNDVVIDNCDGIVTTSARVALAVFTADCVPILLVENRRHIIGAVHAGWRGTLDQIAIEAISCIRSCGGIPEQVYAWIGPAIGGCCYEVSQELASTFVGKFGGLCNQNGRFLQGRHLDLVELNRLQLMAAGVPEEQISVAGICTKHAVDQYYSYRSEGATAGRIVSIIANVTE